MPGLGAFNRHQARVQIVVALVGANRIYHYAPELVVKDANKIVDELERVATAEAELEVQQQQERERMSAMAPGPGTGRQEPAP